MYLHAGAEWYGADKVLLDLVSGINKDIFETIVILPNEGILKDKLEAENIKVRIIKYPILRRKYFNTKGIFKYIIDYFLFSKKLSEIAKEECVDLLHVNTLAVLEGIYLKKKLKKPLVWHVHEIIVKPKLIYKITSWLCAKYSDKVVVVSNAVDNHLMNTNFFKKDQIQTIYNGIDSNMFFPFKDNELREELNIPNNAFIIGMVGRINSWKGQSDFLKSIESLVKEKNNIYGVMVGGVFHGEEWRIKLIEEEINRLGIGDKVKMIDFRSDINRFHSMFDLFILPSTNPDPLPTVVLESMASKTTILGYNHGGIREMINNPESCLVEVENWQKLAEKIKYFYINNDRRKEEAEKNLNKQINYFSKKRYCEDFSTLYLTIVETFNE